MAKKRPQKQKLTGIASVDALLRAANKKPDARFKEGFRKKPLRQQVTIITNLKKNYSGIHEKISELKQRVHNSLETIDRYKRGETLLKAKKSLANIPNDIRKLEETLLKINKFSESIFVELKPGTLDRRSTAVEMLAIRASQLLFELHNECRRTEKLVGLQSKHKKVTKMKESN